MWTTGKRAPLSLSTDSSRESWTRRKLTDSSEKKNFEPREKLKTHHQTPNWFACEEWRKRRARGKSSRPNAHIVLNCDQVNWCTLWRLNVARTIHFWWGEGVFTDWWRRLFTCTAALRLMADNYLQNIMSATCARELWMLKKAIFLRIMVKIMLFHVKYWTKYMANVQVKKLAD